MTTTNDTPPKCQCGRAAIDFIHDDPRRPFGHEPVPVTSR